tara:strand:- start:529 stop:732 length:204 start_codon:yes stop_codon:yes gene_type:complete
MAKFSGEVTFRVKFKDLGVPVGFGMTNAIIFHECATQIYVRSGWCKIDKKNKDTRFTVEVVKKELDW